jgi:uncharacterized protein (DUF885 family)
LARLEPRPAIDYLQSNSFLPRKICEAEVDRYIGMPAQALSYKMGERVIHALRTDAEATWAICSRCGIFTT